MSDTTVVHGRGRANRRPARSAIVRTRAHSRAPADAQADAKMRPSGLL
ncbi:hypothetical protein [Nocardia aurantia]|nr:hypothetical protein [Nocardia aurantia]